MRLIFTLIVVVTLANCADTGTLKAPCGPISSAADNPCDPQPINLANDNSERKAKS